MWDSPPQEQFLQAISFGEKLGTFVIHIVIPAKTNLQNVLRSKIVPVWCYLLRCSSNAARIWSSNLLDDLETA